MTKPKVTVLPITEGATPDPNNINKHTQRGGALLENSLRKRGAFRSIASAGKGVSTPVVMAGNYTLEKAIDAGFTEIVNVHVTGNQIVNVVRDDLDPNSAEAIALGLEDNEIGKQSYSPDIDMLAMLAAGENVVLAALQKEDKVFKDMLEKMIHIETESNEENLEADTDDEKTPSDGSLLALVDVTISEPRHEVAHLDIYRLGNHILVCAGVIDEWQIWKPLLEDGMLLCTYAGAYVVLSERSNKYKMLLVQPRKYICGHILDRYQEIHGEQSIVKVK